MKFQTCTFADRTEMSGAIKQHIHQKPKLSHWMTFTSASVTAIWSAESNDSTIDDFSPILNTLDVVSELDITELDVGSVVIPWSFHITCPGNRPKAVLFTALPRPITSIEHSAEGDISKLIFNDDPTDFFPKFPCFEYRGVKSSYYALFRTIQSADYAMCLIQLAASGLNLTVNPCK